MKVEEIINHLQKTPGLGNVRLLNEGHKKIIIDMEEKNNTGVKECVNREFTILLTHDSTFREPVKEIVIKKNNKIEFPPIPFPEAKGKDVVSSSPSEKVHIAMVKKLNLKLNSEYATLLIGFNL